MAMTAESMAEAVEQALADGEWCQVGEHWTHGVPYPLDNVALSRVLGDGDMANVVRRHFGETACITCWLRLAGSI